MSQQTAPEKPQALQAESSEDRAGPAAGSGGGAGSGGSGTRVVDVVTPCFNRPDDLALLLRDLAGLDLRVGGGRVVLRVLVVDNASSPPLEGVPVPEGLEVQILRLEENTGGSGGYNAGMACVLRRGGEPAPEFLWLVDSDARVRADTLAALVEAMDADPGAVVAGSAVADPETGVCFELGGRLDRGAFSQFRALITEGHPMPSGPVECDYTAACSALVRRDAVERAGLMPETFLNGDDVEWCIRLARVNGGRVIAVPGSEVRHPRFDRYSQLPRYFMSRNAYGPIDAKGLGGMARFARAVRDLPRIAAQLAMGRDDLAALHLGGLRDAAEGRTRGPIPPALAGFERFRPWAELEEALREAGVGEGTRAWVDPRLSVPGETVEVAVGVLRGLGCEVEDSGQAGAGEKEPFFGGFGGALVRLLLPVRLPGVALVSARGRPGSWGRGRVQVQGMPEGFVVRRFRRWPTLCAVAGGVVEALGLAVRLGVRGVGGERGGLPSVDEGLRDELPRRVGT